MIATRVAQRPETTFLPSALEGESLFTAGISFFSFRASRLRRETNPAHVTHRQCFLVFLAVSRAGLEGSDGCLLEAYGQ